MQGRAESAICIPAAAPHTICIPTALPHTICIPAAPPRTICIPAAPPPQSFWGDLGDGSAPKLHVQSRERQGRNGRAGVSKSTATATSSTREGAPGSTAGHAQLWRARVQREARPGPQLAMRSRGGRSRWSGRVLSFRPGAALGCDSQRACTAFRARAIFFGLDSLITDSRLRRPDSIQNGRPTRGPTSWPS